MLFSFDSARLSGRAKAVLDSVAAETRAKADPAKPPILVTGHTDGKGTHPYNVKLSTRRAAVVRRELQARLGTAYRYRAVGRAETEPIAKEGGANDAAARRKNRRVEISYRIKQHTPGAGASSGKAGAPAAFRGEDGGTVATRTITQPNTQRRLKIEVKPFYRDGAYLVAVFEITNLGPGARSIADDFGDIDYAGGKFTAFSIQDPATHTTYRAVRMGPRRTDHLASYVDPGWATFRDEPNAPNRGFFYVPAPPGDAVTFDAGDFGTFPNIPVR